MHWYLDCEFDGHTGPLLSLALVSEKTGLDLYCVVTGVEALDSWVLKNVIPNLYYRGAHVKFFEVPLHHVGDILRQQIQSGDTIIADSPVDIYRFCQALSTDSDGLWASTDFLRLNFEVINIDCYPTDLGGAIQHNAWWDAQALKRKLT